MTSLHLRARFAPRKVAAAVAAIAAGTALAQGTAQDSPAPFRITGGISYGIGARTTDTDTSLLMRNNAPLVGLTSTNAAGRNQDDGDLNYRKGDVFTNVVTGFADLSLNQGPISALLRVQGWHDFEMKDGNVPFGHVPNGYAANQPLSDASARARGKFSNVILSTAFVRGTMNVADVPLSVTVGNQNIGWRGQGIVAGPMAVIDPVDIPAVNRPGGFAETRSVPFPALRAAATLPNGVSLDGFYQLGFEPTQFPLCGTFQAIVDVYGADGCEKMMQAGVGATLSDPQLLAAGGIVALRPGPKPSGSGQFGLSTRWKPQGGTEVAVSYARYTSRTTNVNLTKSSIPGAVPYVIGDPRNTTGEAVYPTGIQTFALEAKHQFTLATVYGSVGYTPNRPLSYPIAEVLQTLTSPATVATLFRAKERALAPGQTLQAWDRLHTSEWQFGGSRELKNVIGAATLALQGEVNARFVHNLPDQNQIRYARADVFGIGPVNGVCGNPAACTNEGYVTKSAWSYTLQAAAAYPKALGTVTLRPRVGLTHDVKGYSYDGLVREGRVRLVAGLDAVYEKTTVSLGALHNVKKSEFDNFRDRNYVTLAVSTRF